METPLKKALLLDEKALIASLLMAAGLLYFGGILHFILVVVFLLFSVAVTKLGGDEKKKMGVYEHMRGWQNVVANGIVPLAALVMGSQSGFIGALAGITSDKFASELGVFGEQPRSLWGFGKVKKGVNGAISFFGTFMSLIGALTIAVAWAALNDSWDGHSVLMLALAGAIGSMGDSVAGVLEERKIGNKYTSNIVGAITGGIAAHYLLQ